MEPDDQLLARSSVDLAAFEEFYRRNVDRIVPMGGAADP